MKIISWNVRGIGKREKRKVIRDMLNKEKPDIVILQETKKEAIDTKIISSLWGVRFKEWAVLPSTGRSGGILMIWDVRVVRGLEVVLGVYSISVLFQSVGDDDRWWFSGVYGPCKSKERKELWFELGGLYGLCGQKWCLGGDFNTVRYPTEKLKGGRITRSMKEFDSFIRETSLHDIELKNSEYTWSNLRERLVCSRLDRFLFTDGWERMHKSVRQEALLRVTSDHCPVILDTNEFKWGPTPFRFENMWLAHKDFKENFKNWWSTNVGEGWAGFRFLKKLELVKEEVKKWNKSAFGDFRLEKNAIMSQIGSLDKREVEGNLDDQGRVERCILKTKLEEVIVKEESSWNQKVRVRGVKEWDNNSKLFHRIASGRKINKMINKIETLNGTILQAEEEVVEEIVNFYERLYNQPKNACFGIEGLDWAEIDVQSSALLERPFEEEEIKSALFSCDRNKAPGPDGFTMAALQDGWEVVKHDILEVFNEFFENGVVNTRMNATYICLIPKKLKSLALKDFRPISLVTSLYKVVAKVLSLRLREVLDSTIDPSQGAFVKGRQILDLVLIANEAVEEYRSKKKMGVVFKADFEKAFDHVRWEFLDFVLEKKGFGARWRKWIMGCLSSANFSIIINGRPRGHFGANRGLRQGDPLSPFLFILVGDVLSKLVKKACEHSLVGGFEIGANKVGLSHLQFADDSIFFISNKEEGVNNLIKVLNVFSLLSGLRINMNKSVVAGINVGVEEMESIANNLGCLVGDWPMNYLGLPLGGNPSSPHFWDPVVEKITRRLDGWHKGCLSRGGRLILLQSVLASIPTYFMSLFKMPVKVASLIEKLMRDFFWEGNGEGTKDHLVRWNMVSKPKSQGGLGVGNLLKRNMAFLGKWLWRFPLEINSLWQEIIASRHGNFSGGLIIKSEPKSTLKSPWRSIANLWEQYAACTKLLVGKGDKVKFWEDAWLGDLALKQLLPRLFRLSLNQNNLIHEVLSWDQVGGPSWNLNFRRNFNDREYEEFLLMSQMLEGYQFNRLEEDRRRWIKDLKGVFSCGSFFEYLSGDCKKSDFQQHMFIWRSGIPTKIKVFNWLASHGKVNTNDLLQIKRPFISISPQWCVLCKKASESSNHMLLHCSFSRCIWAEFLSCLGVYGAFPKTWAEFVLIKWHFKGNKSTFEQIWRFFLQAIAWALWMERNRRIFVGRESNVKEIWSHTCYVVGLWARANKLFDCLDNFMFCLDPKSFLAL